jgi:hypothetical protein
MDYIIVQRHKLTIWIKVRVLKIVSTVHNITWRSLKNLICIGVQMPPFDAAYGSFLISYLRLNGFLNGGGDILTKSFSCFAWLELKSKSHMSMLSSL